MKDDSTNNTTTTKARPTTLFPGSPRGWCPFCGSTSIHVAEGCPCCKAEGYECADYGAYYVVDAHHRPQG